MTNFYTFFSCSRAQSTQNVDCKRHKMSLARRLAARGLRLAARGSRLTSHYSLFIIHYSFVFFLLSACSRPVHLSADEVHMTTPVNIQVRTTSTHADDAKDAIRAAFAAIEELERSASHFRDDSDPARIRVAPVGTHVPVATSTWHALQIAERVWCATDGKYDVTIGPLVELWGFGRARRDTPPTDDEIARALNKIGFENLVVSDTIPAVSTRIEHVHVDLSSVAKGIAVDLAYTVLTQRGFHAVLVNAGGDIRVGTPPGERPWRIGIQVPEVTAHTHEFLRDRVITLTNGAVATSGTYRRFFLDGDTRYAHILDPFTGRPHTTDVISVTVFADTCAVADAWSTGLFVLAADDAYSLAKNTPAIDATIIQRISEGERQYRIRDTHTNEQ